jgi:AraC-like DNA-binding protein
LNAPEFEAESGDRVEALASSVAGVDRLMARLPRYCFPKHTHDRIGLGVMLSGGHDSLYGLRRRIVEPGQVMVVNAGEVHDGMPVGDGGRAYVLAYLDPAVVADGLADATGDPFADGLIDLAPSVEHDVRTAILTRSALDGLGHGVDPLDRDQRLARLFAALARHAGRRSLDDVQRDEAIIRRIKERLAEALDEPLTIAELAVDAGMSRFALIRRFARSVGVTPHAWRMQRRSEAARTLLGTGTTPAQVAAACGFADQAHLTRLFRRHFGLTPGRYAAAYG